MASGESQAQPTKQPLISYTGLLYTLVLCKQQRHLPQQVLQTGAPEALMANLSPSSDEQREQTKQAGCHVPSSASMISPPTPWPHPLQTTEDSPSPASATTPPLKHVPHSTFPDSSDTPYEPSICFLQLEHLKQMGWYTASPAETEDVPRGFPHPAQLFFLDTAAAAFLALIRLAMSAADVGFAAAGGVEVVEVEEGGGVVEEGGGVEVESEEGGGVEVVVEEGGGVEEAWASFQVESWVGEAERAWRPHLEEHVLIPLTAKNSGVRACEHTGQSPSGEADDIWRREHE